MMPADPRPLIAHVVFRFDVGGLENGVVNLINRMPHGQWRHAVIAIERVSATFVRRVRRPDVEFVELAKPPGHLLRLYPKLTRIFAALRPAVAHTRNLAALEAVVPAWLGRIPVRVHGEHGWDVDDLSGASRKYRRIRRLYRPWVSRYVALSGHLANYLATEIGVPRAQIAQICNGVDTAVFRPSGDSRAPILGSPFQDRADWLVGTVGRLAPVKDQVTLARAFVLARQMDAEAARRMRLVIVGDGPLRPAVQAVLEEGGATERAWLAGERSDVPDLMRGLDAFVLPSLAEGISNTILEAMASRVPIVATDVGGNRELLEDGKTGRIVPAADVRGLAEAILADFRDPARARQHAQAARDAVDRQFSLDRMVGAYCDLYQRELLRVGWSAPGGAQTQLLS